MRTLLVVLATVAVACGTVLAQSPPNAARDLADRLTAASTALRACSYKQTMGTTSSISSLGPVGNDQSVWAIYVQGARSRLDYLYPPSGQGYLHSTICDGHESMSCFSPIDPRSSKPRLWQPERGGGDGLVGWIYSVYHTPLADLLRSGKYRKIVPPGPKGDGLWHISLDGVSDLGRGDMGPVTVGLDPRHGWAISKVWTMGQLTQEITSFGTVGGSTVPRTARRTTYMNGNKVGMSQEITFSDVRIGDQPDALFSLAMRPGDFYQANGTRHRIGKDGQRTLVPKAEDLPPL